ncbi:MAG: hypothetical protein ACI822_002276, partial [Gammaproteobacteria bacterium]
MILLKIGGGVSINIETVIADLATIEGPVMIVHG